MDLESTRGFALIEAMVAMMVLLVGVLAVAAASASMGRLAAAGRADTEAARRLRNRFEVAILRGCAGARADEASEGSGGPVRLVEVDLGGEVVGVAACPH